MTDKYKEQFCPCCGLPMGKEPLVIEVLKKIGFNLKIEKKVGIGQRIIYYVVLKDKKIYPSEFWNKKSTVWQIYKKLNEGK